MLLVSSKTYVREVSGVHGSNRYDYSTVLPPRRPRSPNVTVLPLYQIANCRICCRHEKCL
jgi:hypothetical protein